MDIWTVFFCFLVGLFGFLVHGSHFMVSIIMLEMMMLSLINLMVFVSVSFEIFPIFLLFVVFSVCMGGYVISFLVNFSRGFSSDMFFF